MAGKIYYDNSKQTNHDYTFTPNYAALGCAGNDNKSVN